MCSRGAKILALCAKNEVQQKKSSDNSQNSNKSSGSTDIDTICEISNSKISMCDGSVQFESVNNNDKIHATGHNVPVLTELLPVTPLSEIPDQTPVFPNVVEDFERDSNCELSASLDKKTTEYQRSGEQNIHVTSDESPVLTELLPVDTACRTINEDVDDDDENNYFPSDCDDSVVDKDYEPNNKSDVSSENSTHAMDHQENEEADPDETEEAESSKRTKRSRWRKAKPETWIKQKNRKLRDECLPYKNYKGVEQAPKHPRQVDCTKCKFRCTEKFSEDERRVICKKYWILSTYERKKDFILYNVSCYVPLTRRPRKDNARRRQNVKQYYLRKDTEKIQVCQNFFMKTLSISNRVILSAFKEKDELGHFKGTDKRGRKIPSNKTPEELAAKVRAHIESFPSVESHYTRKCTQRKYLNSNLSITKMYNLYKEVCQERGDTEIVSLITYRRIFCREYNLSFFHPKKDQCLTCVNYHQASPEGKIGLEGDFKDHLRRKEESQQAKAADKEKANTDKSFMSVSFDLQSVLQIPSSEVSLTYYMRKLTLYNLTVYEAASPNRAFCFCWTEINGKKGSCEIGTCLLKYIEKLPPSIKSLSLFSDTCGGQNRNLQISALLLYVVGNSHLEVIEQKFLESGHSFMEVDSMHSAIERQKKFLSVFCVNDWINIFKLARSTRVKNKNRPPYETEELKFSDIIDLKELASNLIKNKSLDENGMKVNWMKVKCFKYEKAKPNYIQYRYDYSGEYVGIKITGNRRGRRAALNAKFFEDGLPNLYLEELKISRAKKENLLTMCEKKVIPEVFHPWFQSLPSDLSVRDILPEADILDSDSEEQT